MGSPEDTGARGRPRARSSARPDGARHRGTAVTLRDRLRSVGRSGAGALAVAGAVLVLGLVGAVFSSTTQSPSNVYTAASLDGYVPTTVTATRTSSTTCLVSWTPVSSPPAGMTYDVTNGSGTTVVTGASGTSASATVPVTAVTPTVKARLGSWVSTAATAASSPCNGYPDAPGSLTLTPSDGAVSASWTAPSANGGTLSSYTATISPPPGSGSATCTATVPTTSCSWSSLTNGLSYTVSVTATSNVGTGPAASATTIPYPSTVMSTSNLKLWLDGADSSTLFASNTCTGAAPTTSIGCWVDKSSGGHDATGSSTSLRPAPTTVNGRSAPLFDGTDDYLGIGNLSTLPAGTSSSTTLLAATMTDPAPASSGYRTALFWGEAASAQGRQFFKTTSSAAAVVDGFGTGITSPGTWTSSVGILAGEHTSSLVSGWMNGAPATTSSPTSLNTVTTRANVGRQSSANGYYWQGSVPEVVVLGGTLSSPQRRTVEEYLARKWGGIITPAAPTAVAATAGDAQTTVSWTAPWNGGSAITSYTVTATPSDGTLSTVSLSCASPPCTLAGLTNGATYSVTVAGNNAVGAGPASTAVTVVPRPALLVSSNAVLWLDGLDVDGDGVLEGAAESCDTATSCTTASNALTRWVDKTGGGRDAVQPTTAMAGTYTPATGLVSFSGNGYYQTASGVPTGPDVTAFAVASSATSPFNTYGWFVGGRAANGWTLHPNGAGTSVKFFGMTSGGFNQQTTNGPDVTPSTAITSPHVWDGQISGGTASQTLDTAVDGIVGTPVSSTSTRAAANVVLTVGADDFDLAGRRGQGSLREILVFKTALTSTERDTIRAYLARKWGTANVPGTPTGVTATPSTTANSTASVAWTAPSNGGAPITGYTVTGTPSDGTAAAVSQTCTSSPCTVTGFTDGAAYIVTVAATNVAGTGAASSGVALTTYPAAVMTSAATQLWLDGADTSTLLTSTACTGASATSGQAIGCWKDKSAQANNAAQTTSTKQPTVSSLNSRTTPTFDGTDDYYPLTVAKLPTGTTPSGIFVVAAQEDTAPASSDWRHAIGWGAASTGQGRVVEKGAFNSRIYTETFGTWSSVTSTKDWPVGTAVLADGVVTSTTFSSTVNAVPHYTGTATNNTGTSAGAAVGATGWNTGNGVWKGRIAEVVVTNTNPTAAEARTIQEYLGRKWGLALAPGPVGGVSATVSSTTDGATSVAWTAPTGWNGGAAISSYTVTMTPSDGSLATVTKSCASSPCTVTGLTNGGIYTVTVAAVNTNGTGAATAASTSLIQYPATVMTTARMRLWLDGADAATMYASNTCSGATATTTVGCWADKSGQADNALQATAGLRPTLTTVNSRSVPGFDGVDDYMGLTVSKLPTGTTASTMSFVAKLTGTVAYRNLLSWGALSAGAARAQYLDSGPIKADTYTAGPTASSGSITTGTLFQATTAYTSTSSSVAVNAGTAATTSGAVSTGATFAYLAGAPGMSYYWQGPIPEIVVFTGTLTPTEQRLVDEYLSRKWGTTIAP